MCVPSQYTIVRAMGRSVIKITEIVVIRCAA
jgi:hypothetical protein